MSTNDDSKKSSTDSMPPIRLSASSDSVLDASLEPTVVEPQDPMVGRRLGKYQILAHVAKGGTATVYRALDTVLNREVAVKILHEHLESKREVVERFKKEAMLIAQLRHQNILTVFDFLDFDGRAVLVVEYMPGITLSTLIKEVPKVPEDMVLMLTNEILQGLKVAHDKGITHRDIKPANVLLHPDLGVKISDFGLAKIANYDDGLTKEGIFVGTPSFSSPEQIEGRPIDHRSDIFSLGLTVYILATRSHAFKQKGDSTTTVWFKIVKGRFSAVRNIDPTLSPDLDRILSRALQVEPDKRYQSAQEMITDIEALLKARGLIPYQNLLRDFLRAPKRPYKSKYTYHPPRTKWMIAGLAIVVVAVGIVLSWDFLQRAWTSLTQESSTQESTIPPTPEKPAPKEEAAPVPPPSQVVPPAETPKAATETETAEVKKPTKAQTPPRKPQKEIPIPEAFTLSPKSQVIVANSKALPGIRWKWGKPAEFQLARDSSFKNIVSKSPEANATLKEIKSISPGAYFWRAGQEKGELSITTFESYRRKEVAPRRPVMVLSRFDDVDLEINPWIQELRLDWNAGPTAASYKLEVATDDQFKNLLFSGVVIEKSHSIPRQWEKSQRVFWRVSYMDERGNTFLIDPVRRINLKVEGHAPFVDILEPKPNQNLSGKDVLVRAIGPLTAQINCTSFAKDASALKWVPLVRSETSLSGRVPLTVETQWMLCQATQAEKSNATYFVIPVKAR